MLRIEQDRHGGRRLTPRAAAWWAMLLVGQAAALSLVDAGPLIRYQHYRSLAEIIAQHRLTALVLLAQMLAATVALIQNRARVRAWLAPRIGGLGIVVLLGALAATAAIPSKEPAAWVMEIAIATLIAASAMITAACAAAAVSDEDAARWIAWLDAIPLRRLAIGCAAFVAVVAAVLCVVAYQRHPHVPDEVSYLLQARYFAHGMLTMPAPPDPSAFDIDLMWIDGARWFSPFPPGWPAVLALGVIAGVPWLVNPLLGALATLLAARVLAAAYGDGRAARIGTLLLAASPWHLFLAMSLMSHQLSLVLALTAALGIAHVIGGHRAAAAWALASGLAVGLVASMRPLEGVIVAAFLGALLLARAWRRTAAVLAFGAGGAAAGALTLWYNRAITGRPLVFPVMEYFEVTLGPGHNALGFGASRGFGWTGLDPFPGHGLRDVVLNTGINTSLLGTELSGWAAGSVVALLLVVVLRKLVAGDRLMLAAAGAVVVGHAFYWFAGGPDFGPRYWFLVIVPCVALAGRGLLALDGTGVPRATLAGLALTVSALAVFVPWRAADKYHAYRRMQPDVRELSRQHDWNGALVLVRGNRHPDYASAAAWLPVPLDAGGAVYAWDRDDAARRAALAAFPSRPVWIVEGPTRSGAGFRIVAGPISGAARDSIR